MSTARLYVGNLSYGTTKETLEKTFAQFGEVVSVNIITDRQTGRPKGFAFVELSTPEEADAAKAALNGTELDGRSLNVDNAREQERQPHPDQEEDQHPTPPADLLHHHVCHSDARVGTALGGVCRNFFPPSPRPPPRRIRPLAPALSRAGHLPIIAEDFETASRLVCDYSLNAALIAEGELDEQWERLREIGIRADDPIRLMIVCENLQKRQKLLAEEYGLQTVILEPGKESVVAAEVSRLQESYLERMRR